MLKQLASMHIGSTEEQDAILAELERVLAKQTQIAETLAQIRQTESEIDEAK